MIGEGYKNKKGKKKKEEKIKNQWNCENFGLSLQSYLLKTYLYDQAV